MNIQKVNDKPGRFGSPVLFRREGGKHGYRCVCQGVQEQGHDRDSVDAGVCPAGFGGYLRSDIIWQKGNAMPENVKDRPTRSYEHVFLFP